MLNFLKREANRTRTENGAETLCTTGSACLDLFAASGALRGQTDAELEARFFQAYAEEPDLAMKLLFYTRDVRGGLGERRVFRSVLRQMTVWAPSSVIRNLPYVAEFGRWDDLLCLLGTPCEAQALELIREQLERDRAALETGEPVSLLGKWLPSVNASNRETVAQAKRIARALHMNDAQYRRTLTALRNRIRLLENNLRRRDYTFDYAKQPSRAMFKYRKAFRRNDAERYAAYLEQVAAGEARLHTGGLAPYEIIRPILKGEVKSSQERRTLDETWKAQEDFTRGENALVVVDGSGSMYYSPTEPQPAAVALSLGLYYAERNTGVFHNHFITFSRSPRLVEIRGRDLYERIRYCMQYNEVANTDLQKVFQLILNTAVKYRVPQEELPARLYIISDMEFDACVENGTNFEVARILFARHGYRLPEVVFWNVDSRNRQQPVERNEQGAALVSGCSPVVFSLLREGNLSPEAVMQKILGAERYAAIAA